MYVCAEVTFICLWPPGDGLVVPLGGPGPRLKNADIDLASNYLHLL